MRQLMQIKIKSVGVVLFPISFNYARRYYYLFSRTWTWTFYWGQVLWMVRLLTNKLSAAVVYLPASAQLLLDWFSQLVDLGRLSQLKKNWQSWKRKREEIWQSQWEKTRILTFSGGALVYQVSVASVASTLLFWFSSDENVALKSRVYSSLLSRGLML